MSSVCQYEDRELKSIYNMLKFGLFYLIKSSSSGKKRFSKISVPGRVDTQCTCVMIAWPTASVIQSGKRSRKNDSDDKNEEDNDFVVGDDNDSDNYVDDDNVIDDNDGDDGNNDVVDNDNDNDVDNNGDDIILVILMMIIW